MIKTLALLILMTMAWTTNLSYAQAEDCLPIRFFDGQEARVIGSIDAGGLPLREEPTLAEPVLTIIPLDTLLFTSRMTDCQEGRNWYYVSYQDSESDESITGWVVDGDGYNYWLEPIPICTAPSKQEGIQIDPFYIDLYGLEVDKYDENTNTLHFSYIKRGQDSPQKFFFELDMNSGFVTQKDNRYDGLVTQGLKDTLGIERIYQTNEYWNMSFLSPDQSQILYIIQNPPTTESCAHGCRTDSLWIANIDGSNPIKLRDSIGQITKTQWNADGTIDLSMSASEVFGPDYVVRVCEDGSCDEETEDWLLEDDRFPFEFTIHMPMASPNGEWVAVTVGSEKLYEEGIMSTGAILNLNDGRYIQLPFNGRVAVPILWEDDDTILYPVAGTGWDGRDYDLPEQFYEQDAIWMIDLDFEDLSYAIRWRSTHWDMLERDSRMFNSEQTHHIIRTSRGAIVYNISRGLGIYCFSMG